MVYNIRECAHCKVNAILKSHQKKFKQLGHSFIP